MAEFNHQTFDGSPGAGMPERRKTPRFVFKEIGDPKGAGHPLFPDVRVINLSRGGILIETTENLNPGSVAFVRLVAADAVFLLQGKVLRSRPAAMLDSPPNYECAISFEGTEPVSVPVTANEAAGNPPEQETAYRVTALIPRCGPDLHQIFGLNNW